jgi:hypothetical protein
LTVEAGGSTYCLHGLNAVHLQRHGWYRVDARGDKPGVTAAFCPPLEKLAFSIVDASERDFPEIWPEPLPAVIRVLTSSRTVEEVARDLPDATSISRLRVARFGLAGRD